MHPANVWTKDVSSECVLLTRAHYRRQVKSEKHKTLLAQNSPTDTRDSSAMIGRDKVLEHCCNAKHCQSRVTTTFSFLTFSVRSWKKTKRESVNRAAQSQSKGSPANARRLRNLACFSVSKDCCTCQESPLTRLSSLGWALGSALASV